MEDKKQTQNQDLYSKVVLSLFLSFAIVTPIFYIIFSNLTLDFLFGVSNGIDDRPKNDIVHTINFLPIYFIGAIVLGTVPMLFYVALYMTILKRQKNNLNFVVLCAILAVLVPVYSFCYLMEYKITETLKLLLFYYANAMPTFILSHYLFIRRK